MRVRGLAVSRPIIYGNTTTPLTPAEKLSTHPDHTHKWTIAVRSAASNPLPAAALSAGGSLGGPGPPAFKDKDAAEGSGSGAGLAVGVSTRGRDEEVDPHKMIGGKDDISHFIKKVQFKLHETYAQSTRTVDRPPFQVTETGWGEFEVQIKIYFVPEAAEKPLTLYHHLKLHPWNPPTATTGAPEAGSSQLVTADLGARPEVNVAAASRSGVDWDGDAAAASSSSSMTSCHDATAVGAGGAGGGESSSVAGSASAAPAPLAPPAVVHSWQYDEIVFPEPTESFYSVLIAHPPSPLPSSLPIPTESSSAAEEGERLDEARKEVIKTVDDWREKLIKAEKELKRLRAATGPGPIRVAE